MDEKTLRNLLKACQEGHLDVDAAVEALRTLPFEAVASARVDHHRSLRCGCGEVILGLGKTPEQVREIFAVLAREGQSVLVTRADEAMLQAVRQDFPDAEFHADARAILLRRQTIEPVGHVAILSAGTSDRPVAEEARLTAELMGARVTTHYDVGVAGLHRIAPDLPEIRRASAVVAVAGMEGALASVVGGLVAAPVVAVPTSVGYGASFGGISALLTMLNSCAAGVTVVNIDNGFGGGYVAGLINRLAASRAETKGDADAAH